MPLISLQAKYAEHCITHMLRCIWHFNAFYKPESFVKWIYEFSIDASLVSFFVYMSKWYFWDLYLVVIKKSQALLFFFKKALFIDNWNFTFTKQRTWVKLLSDTFKAWDWDIKCVRWLAKSVQKPLRICKNTKILWN